MQETQSCTFNPWFGKIPWNRKWQLTPASIHAWKIPWTEEPGRLQSIVSQRIGHDWSGWAHTHVLYKRQTIRRKIAVLFFSICPEQFLISYLVHSDSMFSVKLKFIPKFCSSSCPLNILCFYCFCRNLGLLPLALPSLKVLMGEHSHLF